MSPNLLMISGKGFVLISQAVFSMASLTCAVRIRKLTEVGKSSPDHRPIEILQCQCYSYRPKDPDENNCDEYATIRHGAMSTLPIQDCPNRRHKHTLSESFVHKSRFIKKEEGEEGEEENLNKPMMPAHRSANVPRVNYRSPGLALSSITAAIVSAALTSITSL
uniref:Uncharacterized protein n=1 Tax=Glossina pallidipes TaxID=7398 RepID=A0A1B0A5V3_GLOPL